ncbi:hypothetical protein, partial [Snodgrassella sp.]|uniref:hypothetical protein n=1 Tax=Snodgrassella sp. TaxID=2815304 RepID=UPI0025831188
MVERELFIDNTNFNYGESKFNILVGSFVSLTTRIVLPNTFKQLANLILTFIISAIVLRKYLICIDNVNVNTPNLVQDSSRKLCCLF